MRYSLCTTLVAFLFSVPAWAGSNVSYQYARVVNAEPIVSSVRVNAPTQECWNEEIAHYRGGHSRSATPTLLGCLIGGAIGNGLGHNKSNKRVGAVLGAVLGGSIARDIVRHNSASATKYYTTEKVCNTVDNYHGEERIVGYHVEYDYLGEIYSTETNHHPGKSIKVRVAIAPVEY